MASVTKDPAMKGDAQLRTARILTWIMLPLAAVASAGGLLLPGLYRDTAWAVPQMQGQDLVTLIVLPVLLLALLRAPSGTGRALSIWIGVLGYLFYTYTGAAFAYTFNEFFLIYVALFSLSIFALVAAAGGLDAEALKRKFDKAAPRGPVIGFLIVLALMLIALWLSQIIPFLTTGVLPESLELLDAPTNFVYVLDLGIVVPVALLSAFWLWQRKPWGYLLVSCVLIKIATMALALLSMTWFALRANQPVETELAGVWIGLAVSSLGMAAWWLWHCRD